MRHRRTPLSLHRRIPGLKNFSTIVTRNIRYRMGQIGLGVEFPRDRVPQRAGIKDFELSAGSIDLQFRFHPLTPPEEPWPETVRSEVHSLAHRLRCINGNWNSPFLGLDEVRTRLKESLLFSGEVSLELLENHLSVLNFRTPVLDVFHRPELSSDTLFNYQGERFLAPFLAQFEGIILHSSCVVRKGRAAVFLGYDGAGKTTVAQSSREGSVLCDDQVILKRIEGQYRAYGTFWGRMFQAHGQAPVGALFFLEQSNHFSLTPLPPLSVMKYLWTEYPYYHRPLPLKHCSQAFDLMLDLSHRVPSYLMRFGLDAVDWDEIDNRLLPV